MLRKDGTCFVNIADSYAGSGNGQTSNWDAEWTKRSLNAKTTEQGAKCKSPLSQGLKSKDLCLVPERFVLACQAQGWWVRSRIIWWKPSCMPSSQKDRPTTDYEFIYLLTKSPRYFYDGEAIKEAYTKPLDRWGGDKLVANGKSDYDEGTGQSSYRDRDMRPDLSGRNCRTVWVFNSGGKPAYLKGHYATFPEALPERCIKAGTSEHGVCSKCGKQWERIIKRTSMVTKPSPSHDFYASHGSSNICGTQVEAPTSKTLGWRPTCSCNAPITGATVLDPFAGTSTTLFVARKMGRQAVGYELSPKYIDLIEKRNSQGVL